MKFRFLIPIFVFWILLHADHGGGFFTTYGMWQLADDYHIRMAGWYEGMSPFVFPLILTAISYLPVWIAIKLFKMRKADGATAGEVA